MKQGVQRAVRDRRVVFYPAVLSVALLSFGCLVFAFLSAAVSVIAVREDIGWSVFCGLFAVVCIGAAHELMTCDLQPYSVASEIDVEWGPLQQRDGLAELCASDPLGGNGDQKVTRIDVEGNNVHGERSHRRKQEGRENDRQQLKSAHGFLPRWSLDETIVEV